MSRYIKYLMDAKRGKNAHYLQANGIRAFRNEKMIKGKRDASSLAVMEFAKGIVIDGNYTPIEVESAEWVDEDDSILKAKVAVHIKVKFESGIYRDTGFAKVENFVIDSVIREGNVDGEG